MSARSFQQEMAVAQVMLIALTLLNGFVVGLTCTCVFQILTAIIRELSPW